MPQVKNSNTGNVKKVVKVLLLSFGLCLFNAYERKWEMRNLEQNLNEDEDSDLRYLMFANYIEETEEYRDLLAEDLRSLWSVDHIFSKANKQKSDEYIAQFHSDWHPKLREDRFPSVRERIEFYTGGKETGWHHTCSCIPTPNTEVLSNLVKKYRQDLRYNRVIVLDSSDGKNPRYRKFGPYLNDGVEIFKSLDRIKEGSSMEDLDAPIFTMFGDHQGDMHDINIPYFKKFCNLEKSYHKKKPQNCEDFELGQKTKNGDKAIIWPYNTARHYVDIKRVIENDIPWKEKKDAAIWRGSATGISIFIQGPRQCESFERCRIMSYYAHNGSKKSDLVNVGFSLLPDTRMRMYSNRHGWKIGKMTMKDMLKYKAIVVLEGNDVSTGLKWNLYSQSVVIMPPPTTTSWVMETMLEPWVHYVPLKKDLSNLNEMMQWVIDNDEAAQKIVERATLFVHDLIFHEDSEKDHVNVIDGIVKVYLSCFGIDTEKIEGQHSSIERK